MNTGRSGMRGSEARTAACGRASSAAPLAARGPVRGLSRFSLLPPTAARCISSSSGFRARAGTGCSGWWSTAGAGTSAWAGIRSSGWPTPAGRPSRTAGWRGGATTRWRGPARPAPDLEVPRGVRDGRRGGRLAREYAEEPGGGAGPLLRRHPGQGCRPGRARGRADDPVAGLCREASGRASASGPDPRGAGVGAGPWQRG